MIPSVTTTFAPKPAAATVPATANKTTAPAAPDTARASTGETAAGNIRAETAKAVDAPEQAAVAPRLRDQETAENSIRRLFERDRPAGPPPAFEESPLERQARVALDPPDASVESDVPPSDSPENTGESEDGLRVAETAEVSVEPPPTPFEKAEASFAETKTISEPRDKGKLDLRN